MKVIKLILALALSLAIFGAPQIATAAFNPLSGACQGNAQTGAVCKQNTSQLNTNTNPIVGKIHTAVTIIAVVAGAAAVITIIYGGFVLVTAGGSIGGGQRSGDNPARAKQARSTIIGACIGLVIIALSWTIVTYTASQVIK